MDGVRYIYELDGHIFDLLMKSPIIFIISFLFFINLFGRVDFKADSIPNQNFSRLSYIIDSPFKLDKPFFGILH
jgi:hypothetical protein